MALSVVEFSREGYKIKKIFFPENQYTQKNFLNFEDWTNGEPEWLVKIKVFKVDYFIFHVKKLITKIR